MRFWRGQRAGLARPVLIAALTLAGGAMAQQTGVTSGGGTAGGATAHQTTVTSGGATAPDALQQFSSTNSHWLHDAHTDCWAYYRWNSAGVVDVSWSGACTDHQATGHGTLTVTKVDGKESYSGDFVKGRLEGAGTFIGTNGEVLEGLFVDSVANGPGVLTWPSGTHFQGLFLNQRFAGQGKIVWADGDSYDGGFVNGVLNGHGVRTFADGRSFEGTFVNGELSGSVVMRNPDGSKLEGAFVPSRPDPAVPAGDPPFSVAALHPDESTVVSIRFTVGTDGGIRDAHVVDSSPIPGVDKTALDAIAHWHGLPATINGTAIDYKVTVAYTIMRGVRSWANGGHYDGQFVNGRFSGPGKVTWPGGDSYVGNFQGGVENGHGVFTASDGRVIDGNFVGGMVSGHALLRKPDGTKIEGEFVPPRPDPANPLPTVEYPDAARRTNRTGAVTVRYRVGVDGTVKDAHILYFSGTPELDDEAVAEVFRSRMLPATVDGKPIEMDAVRVIKFVLQN